jgi:hypothetical protein
MTRFIMGCSGTWLKKVIKILTVKINRSNLAEIPSTQILGTRVMKIKLKRKLRIKMKEKPKMKLSKRSVDNGKKCSSLESRN